jgi:hypothetical protein
MTGTSSSIAAQGDRSAASAKGGESDVPILELNRDPVRKLGGHRVLQVVPHATHLFEKRGALERVASPATAWFNQHLAHRREPAQQSAS